MSNTRKRIHSLCKLLKGLFPNLTVMETIELCDKILDTIEEADEEQND